MCTPPLTLIIGLIINLISETYSYMKGGVLIYATPGILNNYPWKKQKGNEFFSNFVISNS